jgi:hypothetical protein
MKKLIGSDVFHGKNLDDVVDSAISKALNNIGEFPEIDVKFLNNEWVVICHVYWHEGVKHEL